MELPVALAMAVLAGSPELDQEFSLWVANDGFAVVRDGVRRSDEGATGSFGVEYETGKHRGELGYHVFTERLGTLRTEWLIAEYAQSTEWFSRYGFDRIVGYGGIGIQVTGDLGGAELQNALHQATPTERDLTFETGLQASYSAPRAAALSLSGRLQGVKRVGLLEWSATLSGQVPVGNTGLARLALAGTAGLGEALGLFGALALEVAEQRAVGDAFEFNGAPVNGWVAIPRVDAGYRLERMSVSARWERNHLGASDGWGDSLFTEAITLTFSRSW